MSSAASSCFTGHCVAGSVIRACRSGRQSLMEALTQAACLILLRSTRAGDLLAILSLAMLALPGCGSSGPAVSVSGHVKLDGQPVPAEIQFEPLSVEGRPSGRPVSVFTGEDGKFDASLMRPQETAAGPVSCRVLVRVSRLTEKGVPASFDYEALPEKVVRLKRSITNGDRLMILLTQ